jgi:LysR family transcriptional activator of nhaA
MMQVEQLNFHHLRYFWAVAKSGNLTQTAGQLRVAQSALSSQIHALEAELGEPLFRRDGRRLVLTEAGQLTLAYAEAIFTAGGELVATLAQGRDRGQRLRIGAVATLSRNFQESFVAPLLREPDVRLSIETGGLGELVERLDAHELDVVLTNRAPGATAGARLRCHRLARQPVSVVGAKRARSFRFPDDLVDRAMILPGADSDVRHAFDALCAQRGVRIRVFAEVDDMPMLRLLARDTDALALVPSIVVRDELRDRVLHEHCVVPDLFEIFYALTVERTFEHPRLRPLLGRHEGELLAAVRARPRPRPPSPSPSRRAR